MTTLLESGARPYGSPRGIAVSMLLHGVLIAALVLGTTQVLTPAYEAIETQSVVYVAPPPEVHVAPEPLPVVTPPKAPAPAPSRAEPARPRATQPARQPQRPATPPLVAPGRVPVSVPPIDLSAAPTISDVVGVPAAAEGSGFETGATVGARAGGVVGGSPGGLGSGAAGSAYAEYQVERIVQVVRAAVPRFPDALRSSGVEGDVHATFVVGTNGRVEPGSIEVVDSPHRLFTDAVRSALLDARFRPAEVGGRAVRQLVSQSFSFRLAK